MIVLDASLILGWCFRDEAEDYPQKVVDQLTDAIVPSIWPLEVLNGLLVAERRGRIDRTDLQAHVADLDTFPIRVDIGLSPAIRNKVLEIATSFGLTSYDASYLELALRNSLPVATMDRKLTAAARKLNVDLFDPDS